MYKIQSNTAWSAKQAINQKYGNFQRIVYLCLHQLPAQDLRSHKTGTPSGESTLASGASVQEGGGVGQPWKRTPLYACFRRIWRTPEFPPTGRNAGVLSVLWAGGIQRKPPSDMASKRTVLRMCSLLALVLWTIMDGSKAIRFYGPPLNLRVVGNTDCRSGSRGRSWQYYWDTSPAWLSVANYLLKIDHRNSLENVLLRPTKMKYSQKL